MTTDYAGASNHRLRDFMRTRVRIEGMPPHEYAAMWGDSSQDGVYFYNYSAESCEKTALWLREFAAVIARQIRQVEEHGEGDGKPFDKGSIAGLARLLYFVNGHYRQVLTQEQQLRDLVERMCGVHV